MAYLLQLIGALLPTGLLAAFFRWLFRKLGRTIHPVAVHALSLLTCGTLGMLGRADGRDLWSVNRFADALTVYLLPQAVWLFLELVRRRGAGGALQQPATEDVGAERQYSSEVRRGYRVWSARLHGGQLVMLLLVGLPSGLLGVGAGVTMLADARSARADLLTGRFTDAADIYSIGGELYRKSGHLEPGRLERLIAFGDSLKATGVSDYSLEEIFRRNSIPLDRQFIYSSRANLEERAATSSAGFLIVAIGAALLGACVAALWHWFGARARPVS